MQILNLQSTGNHIQGEIRLTGSKSESNRALILKALSKDEVQIENLSEAEDTVSLTQVLNTLLSSTPTRTESFQTIDIGPAGTAMRFLTSFLSIRPGEYKLTGSERMLERPIGILVEALQDLGAQIQYENKDGYPPLRITGGFKPLKNHIKIHGGVSSQYLSSLLLIANSLDQGLQLEIEGELTSRPYLTMTLQMLEECGIQHDWNESIITIAPQSFTKTTLYIEPDWSAASYWYSIVALSENGKIFLKGLKNKSLQGDRAIVEWMEKLGVKTEFQNDGILLSRIDIKCDTEFVWDLTDCPDLAQTLIVCAAALRKNLSFTGLHTLKIKETDRIQALQKELLGFGVRLIENQDIYTLHTEDQFIPDNLVVESYDDHRMAMAFAPLALVFPNLQIVDPQVVGKSYPNFWEDLKSIGIQQKTLS